MSARAACAHTLPAKRPALPTRHSPDGPRRRWMGDGGRTHAGDVPPPIPPPHLGARSKSRSVCGRRRWRRSRGRIRRPLAGTWLPFTFGWAMRMCCGPSRPRHRATSALSSPTSRRRSRGGGRRVTPSSSREHSSPSSPSPPPWGSPRAGSGGPCRSRCTRRLWRWPANSRRRPHGQPWWRCYRRRRGDGLGGRRGDGGEASLGHL